MQAEVLVTNILHTKTAFGVLAEGTESVFIPGRVAEAANLRIGQTVTAMVIPNPNMPEKTPWMAVHIMPSSAEDTLADEIRADLERGPATALQVSRSIGQPLEIVQRKMREMKLVHDTIYALSIVDLVDEGED